MNAWLIEKKNSKRIMCLGECCGYLRFTIPQLAIWYCRKQDAESGIRAHHLEECEAVEHSFE